MMLTTQQRTLNLMKFQNFMHKLGFELNIARQCTNNKKCIEMMFNPVGLNVENLSPLVRNKEDNSLIMLLNNVLKDYGLVGFQPYGKKDTLWVQEFFRG